MHAPNLSYRSAAGVKAFSLGVLLIAYLILVTYKPSHHSLDVAAPTLAEAQEHSERLAIARGSAVEVTQ